MARFVLPGVPCHVVHRGNRRGEVFFSDEDRRVYLAELATALPRFGVKIWGWCLMTNHVHLLAVPETETSLARAIGLVHGRHSRRLNAAQGWTGHAWANRFFSTALDEPHLWEAIRYVELNPVRAGLAERPDDWPWSSARAHLSGAPDTLLDPLRPFAAGARDPLTGRAMSWADYLAQGVSAETLESLRTATRTGRPLGSKSFVQAMESQSSRTLAPRKRGRKPKAPPKDETMDFTGGK